MKTILYVKSSDRPPSILKNKGFLRGAHLYGWQVQSVTLPGAKAPELAELVAFWKADAVVCDCGGFSTPPDPRETGDCPAVWISCRPAAKGKKTFTINDDSARTADEAAKELLQTDRTDCAFVHFPRTRAWSKERAARFEQVVRMHGCGFHAFAADDAIDVQAWVRRLRKWIRALPRPCGIFAANDVVSNHVRGICAAENLRIPEDVAIVGVDNDESICEAARPRLSSVLADNERMGFLAARVLAARFRSPRMKPVQRTVPPLMVVRRESTRPRRQTDERIVNALELIREKACEGLRARDVLNALEGSRRKAEMHFREATGHSVLEEIQRVRMERAQEFLCDRTRPVKVVAQMCGYASEPAFRRVYCAHYGALPKRR